jgi:hypothetical protein
MCTAPMQPMQVCGVLLQDLNLAMSAKLCYESVMSMNVQSEIRDLKRRVSDIEASFGFLTQQVTGMHKDLLTFQESADQKFFQIGSRLDSLDQGLSGLRNHLPKIVSEAMRDSLTGKPRRKTQNK